MTENQKQDILKELEEAISILKQARMRIGNIIKKLEKGKIDGEDADRVVAALAALAADDYEIFVENEGQAA